MPKEQSAGEPTTRRYSSEEKAAAVRMVRALRVELGTEHRTVHRVAGQLGYRVESVRSWVRQADIDEGRVPGLSTTEAAGIKVLEQENNELKRANEILKGAASFFGAELDRRHTRSSRLHRRQPRRCRRGSRVGVELICSVLQMAPSTYYAAKARVSSARAQRDAVMMPVVHQSWEDNYRVYGTRKVWKAARRAGHDVGRIEEQTAAPGAGRAGSTTTQARRTSPRRPLRQGRVLPWRWGSTTCGARARDPTPRSWRRTVAASEPASA